MIDRESVADDKMYMSMIEDSQNDPSMLSLFTMAPCSGELKIAMAPCSGELRVAMAPCSGELKVAMAPCSSELMVEWHHAQVSSRLQWFHAKVSSQFQWIHAQESSRLQSKSTINDTIQVTHLKWKLPTMILRYITNEHAIQQDMTIL
ncbi:hypothetical protein DPMN_073138 [Dreissena polymorpha]|uniref:Uncharacterized protein n=1 Tax=Dreissena polymorpha TaxID=45954 RepID=A0A9D4BYJ2_DREPO|nr:hypothetical protein DPMN_073138 [Dreissena polymorpha]